MYMIKKWLAPMLAGWFGIKIGAPEKKVEPGKTDNPTVTSEDNIEKAKNAANTALTITSYK